MKRTARFRRLQRWMLPLISVLLLPPAAHAAHRGELIRLRYDRGRKIKGKVVSLSGKEVVIAESENDSVTHISVEDVTRIERYVGERSYRLMGFFAGAIAGGVIGYKLPVEDSLKGVVERPVYTVLGILIGAGVGTLAGHIIRTDIWERMPPLYLRSAAEHGGDLQLAVQFQFH
jgi:hypothetical protein